MHTQNNTCIKKYCFRIINTVCMILSTTRIFSNLLMIILTLSELYTNFVYIYFYKNASYKSVHISYYFLYKSLYHI